MNTSKKQENQESVKLDKKKEGITERTIIEIEFCTNCDAHLFTVRHQQAKYSSHYDAIKKRLQEHKIGVRKKSVPENLYKKSPYCPSNVYYRVQNNQLVYFPEIGSFEVYLNGTKIFSKLQTLKWPTAEIIHSQVQKHLLANSEKTKIQTKIQPKQSQQNAKKQQSHEIQNKKGQFRIKKQEFLNFRYSIDKRNLFKKPENNYLYRKSLTSRYQNTQSTTRKNNTSQYEKQSNQEQLPLTQGRNRKDLTDQFVIQMYQKKQAQKIVEKVDIPQVPQKARKKNTHNNIYLQPIFPKTSVNLQNYARQKMKFANKIHEQRKVYEASKNLPKSNEISKGNIIINAKINEDYNTLFKDKELKNIKEATEENQPKQKQNKNIAPSSQEHLINKSHHQQPLPQEPQQNEKNKTEENEQKENQKIQMAQKRAQQPASPKQKDQNVQQLLSEKQKQLIHIKEAIDINNIVTTKTINDPENNNITPQQNTYQAQFEQEQQNNEFKNNEKPKIQAQIQELQQKQQPQNQPLEKQQSYQEEEFEQQRQIKQQPEAENQKLVQQNTEVHKKAQLQVAN